MNCPNCNNPISQEDKFCRNCSYQIKIDKSLFHEKSISNSEFTYYSQNVPGGFINKMLYWTKIVFKKYAVFEGRATRAEFWYYSLFYMIIIAITTLSIVLFSEIFKSDDSYNIMVDLLLILLGIWVIINFIPMLSVTIRRLHDVNLSGWWILVSLIPNIGPIILLILLAKDSYPYDNKYGKSSKRLLQFLSDKKDNEINQYKDDFIYCRNCNHKNNINNNFCTNCGEKLN